MIVIREPSAHRKLREFDGSRSMSAIPEFRESASEMADRIRAQLRMRFGCDEEDFEERMERQWEIEKRVRRSIEERQVYAPATFGSVSRNAEKLLQTLKDRKKFLEGQIRCSSGPVFAPGPIEVRPRTSLSMSMRSSLDQTHVNEPVISMESPFDRSIVQTPASGFSCKLLNNLSNRTSYLSALNTSKSSLGSSNFESVNQGFKPSYMELSGTQSSLPSLNSQSTNDQYQNQAASFEVDSRMIYPDGHTSPV